MTDRYFRPGHGWIVCLALLLQLFTGVAAWSAGTKTAAEISLSPGAREELPVGITEHLGSRIPLDMTFHDETGTPVRLADLVTGPTIILPVYFSCSNVCYNLQWGMAQVFPKIKSRPMEDYRVISVSFDETDQPRLAAQYKRVYLTAMHAPFPEGAWRFLTGNSENIRRLTDAAGYGFQRKGRDFLHPSVSFIITGDGTIVRYLYGTAVLPKDLALALLEARDGTQGTTIRKIVDYCFTFDQGQKTYAFNLLRVSATLVILCTGGFMVFLIMTGKKRKQMISRK
jgi:protein SCO1/2